MVSTRTATLRFVVVEVVSGVVVFESTVAADSGGYAQALKLVERAPGRRAFAIEGTGSFGAGLTRFLTSHDEWVLEVGRLRRERRSGGKTDALDAVLRAARSVLTQQRPSTPRAGGERQALQALVAAREGAVNAKRAGLCQLRDLLITTPEPLRSELRPLTRARLLQRLAATRPHGRPAELRGSLLALRSIARRVLQRIREERELELRQIEKPTRQARTTVPRPARCRPAAAAQLVLSWSHKGRITS